MSIFKSTFKPFVVRQIKARQDLLSKVERPVEFAKYVSSKAPWIRMTSFVDYENSSALAKKYVLLGGTLYDFDTESNTAKLRSGIGGRGASYGGDISSTQYGIRPMPGITSMTTRSLGAYGSLTEATVKFYAWDVKQLEDLSILFLRPGYKVLLEWGWSMYLDTSVNGEEYDSKTNTKILNTDYNSFSIKNTPFNTVDCFNDSITQDDIYDSLQKLRHKYSGNYDGVLGSIRNFEYELMPNGSYECTTVLMSIGDVIDTIRMNDTISGTVNGDEQNTGNNSEIKSQFELLFDAYCKLNKGNNRNLKKNSFIAFIDAEIKPEDAPYIDTTIFKNSTDIDLISNQKKQSIPISDKPPIDERYQYYIQFSYLIHILNTYKNLFSDKKQKQINIEIPSGPLRLGSVSNGLCQASFNSISINPNVVLIRNSKAVLFKDKENNSGFNPKVFDVENPSITKSGPLNYSTDSLNTFKEYLYSDTNLGLIGNLYINIGKIISLYKELSISGGGYVYVGTFLSRLLDDVSFSLGSINDFDKYVTDSKICIIDKHYTELPSESSISSKFKINILGNSSIIRSHKINSKIFPSQATMIAIAAQSRENIASIQTSTYNYLNEGLKDRLFKETTTQNIDRNTTEIEYKKNILNQILVLIQFVKDYILINNNISVFHEGNLSTMNGYLNSLLVEIDNGTDYKGVIPISVDLTMDGISGLTIGEIFTVDKNVLPKDYKQKSIGFIVTKISNEVVTTGWKTSIGSQICILDQQEKQIRSKERALVILGDLTKEIANNIAISTLGMKIFNVLAAFTSDYLAGGLKLDENGNIKRTLKTVYTSTALREYPINSGGDSLTASQFFEYFSSLLKTYKKADAEQLFYLGFPIKLYKQEIIEKLIKPPLIQSPINDAVLQYGEPLATTGPGTIEVETFGKMIKNNIFYQQMPEGIKASFDKEYARVLELFSNILNTKAAQDIEDNSALGQVSSAFRYITTVPNSKGPTQSEIITFDITNPKDIDQITGNIPTPLPLYAGYKIFALKRNTENNRIEVERL